jgi:glucose uptake protein GlcU
MAGEEPASLPKCVFFACCGGLAASAASNIVPYYKHIKVNPRRDENGISPNEMSQGCSLFLTIISIILNLGSIAGFLMACAAPGPVSVAMPVLTASKLLSSMIFQICVGIGDYNKSTRVGTLVLCAAVMCLIEQGPEEPDHPDMFAQLTTRLAYSWLSFVAIMFFMAWIAVCVCDNDYKGMLAYSMVVASTTALGASCGKGLSILKGLPLVGCISLYLCFGAISFIYAAKANFRFPQETFMTVSECMQLSINALNGLFIWEDWRSIHESRHAITYSAIYAQIILGVYLSTDFDLLDLMRGKKRMQGGEDTDKQKPMLRN